MPWCYDEKRTREDTSSRFHACRAPGFVRGVLADGRRCVYLTEQFVAAIQDRFASAVVVSRSAAGHRPNLARYCGCGLSSAEPVPRGGPGNELVYRCAVCLDA